MIEYFYTLKNLKFIQIRYQIRYRIRRVFRRLTRYKPNLLIQKAGYPVALEQIIVKADSFNNFSFTFLNQTITFSNDSVISAKSDFKINWKVENYGKLWAYNLNYMDYLLQKRMVPETGLRLIKNFIDNLPENKTGLESYPISLRSVNWIKFISVYSAAFKKQSLEYTNSIDTINASLYAQYEILRKNLEFHLLGNHLLENGYSLLFGAFYFRDENLWTLAKQLLEKELEEQILPDGAHYELSPMYHQILTDRLLDSVNLLQNNKVFSDQESLLTLLVIKASKMISWLNAVTFSSGEIPLFNDSAFGIAPLTDQLNNYARRLGISNCDDSLSMILSNSGFQKFFSDDYECLFDLGEIGPRYQAGHAHADTFTFELYVRGNPFIVDTGTSTYNPGKRRLLERGTKSHNTVTISDIDSSYIWASHRVGSRATITTNADENGKIIASHSGYRRLNSTLIREIEASDNQIIITDLIKKFKTVPLNPFSKSKRIGTARLHIHPQRKAYLKNQVLYIDDLVEISFGGFIGINQCEYYYASEFNKLQKSWVYEIIFDKELFTRIRIGDFK